MTPLDSVGGEFLATRRSRWTAQLERLGVQRWRAHQLAAGLLTGADWRALTRDLFGAAVLATSLLASATALFLF